ncbi:MAG: hypothetical protein RIS60_24 [Pseudomonadota bacterium]
MNLCFGMFTSVSCLSLLLMNRILPSWKNKYSGMALKRHGKNLCTIDTQIDAIVFDGRNCGLGYARHFRQLPLTKFLKLSHNSKCFTN